MTGLDRALAWCTCEGLLPHRYDPGSGCEMRATEQALEETRMIGAVARAVAIDAISQLANGTPTDIGDWDDWPDLSERDWQAVLVEAVAELNGMADALHVGDELVEKAYAWLGARAAIDVEDVVPQPCGSCAELDHCGGQDSGCACGLAGCQREPT